MEMPEYTVTEIDEMISNNVIVYDFISNREIRWHKYGYSRCDDGGTVRLESI